jgi:hypothetical protein
VCRSKRKIDIDHTDSMGGWQLQRRQILEGFCWPAPASPPNTGPYVGAVPAPLRTPISPPATLL